MNVSESSTFSLQSEREFRIILLRYFGMPDFLAFDLFHFLFVTCKVLLDIQRKEWLFFWCDKVFRVKRLGREELFDYL